MGDGYPVHFAGKETGIEYSVLHRVLLNYSELWN